MAHRVDGGLELLAGLAHIDDLVNGSAVVAVHGLDVELLGQGLAPADELRVAISRLLEEGRKILVAIGGVLGFDGAEDALARKKLHGSLLDLGVHGAVKQDLLAKRHIAAGAGDHAVKAKLEQRREHVQVSPGAKKDLIACRLGASDGGKSACRRLVASRRSQGAVDVQKNQLG